MAKNTLLNQVRSIQNEAEAYEFLEELRWKGTPVCPHCGSGRVFYLTPKGDGRKTRTGTISDRRVWKCGACRRQFSVLTNTIFHGTKVEVRIWLNVVVEMCQNKNGMAAREIERKYGVAPKTAWHMAHRVREAMKRRAPGAMVGTIIADETYIGGSLHNKHRSDIQPVLITPRKPRNSSEKTPVLSLVNAETGEVRSAVVTTVDGRNLRKVIAEQVNMGQSVLWTDEGAWYHAVGREFLRHQSVNHSEGIYARGRMSSNRVEGFFSQLKRSIDGTHHRVSPEHLPRYLTEFDFRYSTCKLTDAQRVDRLLGQVDGRRLSYKRVKA